VRYCYGRGIVNETKNSRYNCFFASFSCPGVYCIVCAFHLYFPTCHFAVSVHMRYTCLIWQAQMTYPHMRHALCFLSYPYQAPTTSTIHQKFSQFPWTSTADEVIPKERKLSNDWPKLVDCHEVDCKRSRQFVTKGRGIRENSKT
jgi:hypothetical protein